QPVGGLVDLGCVTSKRTVNCGFYTLTTLGFETGGNVPANAPGIASFAIRCPISGGMESRNLMQECITNGYGVGAVVANHMVIVDCVMNWQRTFLAFDDTAGVNAPVTVLYCFCSSYNYKVTGWDPSNGVKSLTTFADATPRQVWGIMGGIPWAAANPFSSIADYLDANNLIGGDLRSFEQQTLFGYGNPQPWTRGRGSHMGTSPIEAGITNGTATLVAGAVTVTPPNGAVVNATSRIRAGILTPAGTPGAIFIGAVTAGTSFQIKSTSGADTSVVWWEIANP